MLESSAPELDQLLSLALALASCEDVSSFRSVLADAMQVLVPSDTVAVQELDLATGVAVAETRPAGVSTRALESELLRTIDQHPVWSDMQRTGTGDARKISDFMSRRDLHRTELYDAVYRHIDVEYQLTAAGTEQPQLALIASRKSRDFAERDRAVLNLMLPQALAARDSVEAKMRARRALDALERDLDSRDAALIILDARGRIDYASDRAAVLLAKFDGRQAPRGRLPQVLEEWLPRARRTGEPLETAARLPFRARLLPGRPEAISIERVHPPRVLPDLGLTEREAEVLELASWGLTNQEIADDLVISPRTVQNHLASIYEKLGVQNRTEASRLVTGS